MANLADILQSEVASEISAVTAEADSQAKAIVDVASEKAGALTAAKQRLLEAEHAAALRRAESAAELLLNQARIAARGQVVDQVKAGVLQALQGLASQPDFGEVQKKLADEALKGLNKAEAVVVNPAHAKLLEGWAQEKDLKLITNSSINHGVRVIAEGGKSYVQNTLPERLERAWGALSAKAAKAIWG